MSNTYKLNRIWQSDFLKDKLKVINSVIEQLLGDKE